MLIIFVGDIGELSDGAQQVGPLLLTNTGQISITLRVWISNYINTITHSRHNFNGGLDKPPLKLGHGWVMTSHI